MTRAVDTGADERHGDARPVLEVFGLQLEVSNAALADLLSMDAKSALTTDVRELVPGSPAPAAADPLAAPEPAPGEDARMRHDFRRTVLDTGTALGFEVTADGTWRSPLGVTILTRSFEKRVEPATAAHYVRQLAARGETGEAAILLVAEAPASVGVFAAAIRALRVHDRFRVVSAADLTEVRTLRTAGVLDHRDCLVLLAPVADIDAGCLLSLIHSRPTA